LRTYITTIAFTAFLFLFFLPVQSRAGKIRGTVEAQGLRSPEKILVYLAKGPSLPAGTAPTKFVMDQRSLTFIPHILPVLVGSTVDFPNNDKVNHNVFSLSRAKKFNLGSYKAGDKKTVQFDTPGIVEVRCDVHAEMLAYILVLKNPFWGLTDDQGRFEIPEVNYLKQNGSQEIHDLPAGNYVIKTWHEKLKTRKTLVAVPEKGPVSVQIKITRGTPGVLYK